MGIDSLLKRKSQVATRGTASVSTFAIALLFGALFVPHLTLIKMLVANIIKYKEQTYLHCCVFSL